MKVVILAGGFGTRLAEYTDVIPKPMVDVGGRPILWHIMNIYASYGYNEFVVALGYKGEVIKEYFLNYYSLNSDFTVDLKNGYIEHIHKKPVDWKVTLIDTGLSTMTGGRLKRLKEYIGNETFMLTYGDGVADVDVGELVKYHREHGKIATVTAVHPAARFGELVVSDEQNVMSFKEKPQTTLGWVNGGFFVLQPEFLDLIDSDSTVLEETPLEKVAEMGELKCYYHESFWQCMDTVRDRNLLESMWKKNIAPWKVW
ncbi:glucose-1-phosphate cytidylyltransferase [Methanolobus sp.]|jgi:glucose-1-phosphate cytidylyltransferase|uniref:glucose-1-phosphate cytidylyltransferase n=1 Tax=Methanolobus sp. TaxID=1874737 RepID=UPI0025F5FD9F|nr:glucose-1-phosphate cytidylyltransferase [Methanolobus sp.]